MLAKFGEKTPKSWNKINSFSNVLSKEFEFYKFPGGEDQTQKIETKIKIAIYIRLKPFIIKLFWTFFPILFQQCNSI